MVRKNKCCGNKRKKTYDKKKHKNHSNKQTDSYVNVALVYMSQHEKKKTKRTKKKKRNKKLKEKNNYFKISFVTKNLAFFLKKKTHKGQCKASI